MARSTCWACAKRVRAKILQASTSEVYGDPTCIRRPRSYWGNVNPIGPRSCYDEGKRCAETLFFDYHRQHDLRHQGGADLQHLRPAHASRTTGAWCRTSSSRRCSGEPITIYGDGSQTRSFCYVDDLIEGFIRLMDAATDVTGPVNIGNPGEFTIRELAEMVIDDDRLALAARLSAAAAGRPEAAPARYLAGQARCSAGSRASRWRRA